MSENASGARSSLTKLGWTRALGPGILFAGAAIGVSHLVQSTRAGAVYGLALIGVVLLANCSKYPALSFGARYTAATGFSLLEGYRRQGRWVLVSFGILTCGTMFIISAGVTLVTAAIFNQVLLVPLVGETSLFAGSVVLLILVAVLLATGGYRWLHVLMKGLLGMMGLLTIAAALWALPRLDWATVGVLPPPEALEPAAIGFLFALVGWMPAPVDISVWSSLWARAHQHGHGARISPHHSSIDFHIGFILCILLALCFMVLGCVVMYQEGVAPQNGGVGLTRQILALFTRSLGDWSYPFVAAGALGVMVSTMLTVLDAIPRVLVVLCRRWKEPESKADDQQDIARTGGYWLGYGVLAGGTCIVLATMLENLTQMVDLATGICVVTTPILAVFNHRAMFSADVPATMRPGRAMHASSIVCMITMGIFALMYLFLGRG